MSVRDKAGATRSCGEQAGPRVGAEASRETVWITILLADESKHLQEWVLGATEQARDRVMYTVADASGPEAHGNRALGMLALLILGLILPG